MLNRGSRVEIDIPRPETGVISVVALDTVGQSGLGIGSPITVLILCSVYQVSLLPVSPPTRQGAKILIL
jgi:hypothetical protein